MKTTDQPSEDFLIALFFFTMKRREHAHDSDDGAYVNY